MGFKKFYSIQRDVIKFFISYSFGMCGIEGNYLNESFERVIIFYYYYSVEQIYKYVFY